MSEWKKFNEKNWDEPGWIFCDNCGTKNRSNSGWYRRERTYDPLYESLKMQEMMLYPHMPPIQKREYCCNWCWKKQNSVQRLCSNCKKPGHTKRICSDMTSYK